MHPHPLRVHLCTLIGLLEETGRAATTPDFEARYLTQAQAVRHALDTLQVSSMDPVAVVAMLPIHPEGWVPTQAHGDLCGFPWYYRARHDVARLTIAPPGMDAVGVASRRCPGWEHSTPDDDVAPAWDDEDRPDPMSSTIGRIRLALVGWWTGILPWQVVLPADLSQSQPGAASGEDPR